MLGRESSSRINRIYLRPRQVRDSRSEAHCTSEYAEHTHIGIMRDKRGKLHAGRRHQLARELRTLAALHDRRAARPANLSGHALVAYVSGALAITFTFVQKYDLRNQYSMKSFRTVPVVPSAMISKKDAHSPQLKPSASCDFSCFGLVFFDVASLPIRASANCCTVISGVLKYDAVSAQTVSLKGRGLAKKRSERLRC